MIIHAAEAADYDVAEEEEEEEGFMLFAIYTFICISTQR